MNKNFNEKKEFKKIKENITEVEYKKLMSFVRGNETLRLNTKQNLLRTFTILFFTGLRLNEVQELKIIDIKNLLENGNVKISLCILSNCANDSFSSEIMQKLSERRDVISISLNKEDGKFLYEEEEL